MTENSCDHQKINIPTYSWLCLLNIPFFGPECECLEKCSVNTTHLTSLAHFTKEGEKNVEATEN